MKKRLFVILLFMLAMIVAGSPLFAQMPGMGMMGSSMARHRYFMMNGIPSPYRDMSNPLSATKENIADGRKLYMADCASCHGKKGLGNGPAGGALNPPPSDLAALMAMPMATDSYLYWTIAEGGRVLNTAMPSFKDTLKRNQIWKVILFLRNGIK